MALECYQKALEIRMKNSEAESRPVGILYNNMGLIHMSSNDYSKALELLLKAHNILGIGESKEDVSGIVRMYSIGLCYAALDNHCKSLEYLESGAEISERALGKEHTLTFTFRKLIDAVHKDMAKEAEK